MNSTIRTRILTALATGVVALGLVSCAQAAPNDSANYEADIAAWDAAMRDCMTDAGYDMGTGDGAAPAADDSAAPNAPEDTADAEPDTAAMEAAFEACTHQVGDMPVDPNADPAQQAEALQLMVDCLRAEGYEVEDPDGSGALTLPGDIPQEALDRCNEQMNSVPPTSTDGQ